MKKIFDKKIIVLSTISALISLFSVGFASFLIPGGSIQSSTSKEFTFEFGNIVDNIKGVYVKNNSYSGFKYSSNDTLEYSYSKTTIDLGFTVNKEEILLNDENAILTIELSANTSFFDSVTYENYFTFYYLKNEYFKMNSSQIERNGNKLTASFYVISNDYYSLNKFINRYSIQDTDIDLVLSLNFIDIPNTYNFNSLYASTNFTFSLNCGGIE